MTEDKARENRLRRWAKRLGLILRKSRARYWNIDNYQGYMLINYYNTIVAGEKFNLSLDEVENILEGEEEQRRALASK